MTPINTNKIIGLAPILETTDLKESIAFYIEVLGFQCDGIHPNGEDPVWASLRRGGANVMLSARNAHSGVENPTMTGSLYLYPDNVDAVWEELKDKTRVAYGIEDFDYGMREFAVYDHDGYLLQFGQDMDEVKARRAAA